MKKILLLILVIFLTISAYSQSGSVKRSKGAKKNSIASIYQGKTNGHIATEGDGTGGKIFGEKIRKLSNRYGKFLKKRKNFNSHKYHLKTGEGEAIKPSR